MGYQDDWMMRQISVLSHYVAKLVFGKSAVKYELGASDMLSETDQLHLVLDRLIREHKICEAEDMLFENLSLDDRYVELAMDFYQKLNGMTDSELEESNFSRDEVYDGYIEILTRLGIPVEQFVQ